MIALLIVGLSRVGSPGSSASAPGFGTTTSPATSAPLSLADPLAGARAGSCYANNGTEDDPRWRVDPGCAPGSFYVVAVESDTTDTSSACNGVPNWNIDIPDQADDQVLCLQMNFPLPATVPQYTCVRESGPARDPTFPLVTS